MAERRNILQQFSDRFAAKEKERKARQADIQRRASKATRAATSNVKDVVRGAAKLPVTAFDYLRTSKPMDVARDVGRFAVGMGEDIAADPAGFAAETVMAPIVAARDFAVTREKAAEARAAGDTETADKLEQLAALAVVGGVPIVGKGAKKAARKGVKEATEKGAKAAGKPEAPAIVKSVSGSKKRAADTASYDVEKIARQYPDVGEPVMRLDKKKGTMYPSKGDTPESLAVKKARAEANAAIAAGEYTPFFDIEKRFYADPSQYNLVGRTLTDVMPKKQATIEKYSAMANDPAALARLSEAYDIGSQFPGASRWYAMGQLEDEYLKAFGPDVGRQLFKERFADSMAATTGGMDPMSNFTVAQYMNHLRNKGLPSPKESYELPYPVGGGKYGVMPNIRMYDSLINSGKGLSINEPKRFNFSGNFLGDIERATVDEQMMSAWDPKLSMPPGESYGVFEDALGQLARKLGVAPAEFQDVTWAGIKKQKEPGYEPKPMIQMINEAIERTARITGQDPDEVLSEAIVKQERPTYAKGGKVKHLAAKYGCKG